MENRKFSPQPDANFQGHRPLSPHCGSLSGPHLARAGRIAPAKLSLAQLARLWMGHENGAQISRATSGALRAWGFCLKVGACSMAADRASAREPVSEPESGHCARADCFGGACRTGGAETRAKRRLFLCMQSAHSTSCSGTGRARKCWRDKATKCQQGRARAWPLDADAQLAPLWPAAN